MKKFKNVELAEIYKVSEKSIRNWIDGSKKKKIDLELLSEKDKSYIADTPGNHLLMKILSRKGKKFKNKKSRVEISPTPAFYKIFNEQQIINIITDIETHKEIDLKYIYLNDGISFDGASHWNDYFQRSLKESGNNTPKNTLSLIDTNTEYIYSLIKDYKHVNVIDIGVGNAEPVKNLLKFLSEKEILKKYIGIDYSKSMLDFAHKNLIEWFGEEFPCEFHTRDFTYEGIRDLLFTNTKNIPNESIVNIVLFLGSTIENQRHQRHPLRIIKNSLGHSDIFIMTQTLDNEDSKRLLDFNYQQMRKVHNSELFFFIPDLLNIKPEYYEEFRNFNIYENARIIKIKLMYDINLKIQTENINTVINLHQNDFITIWRHKHHTLLDAIKDFNKVGFDILHTTTSLDSANLLIVGKVKHIKE